MRQTISIGARWLEKQTNATEGIVPPFLSGARQLRNVPDAVETMLALGRRADAEPLIKALETNGHSLDRPWMLAVGAVATTTLNEALQAFTDLGTPLWADRARAPKSHRRDGSFVHEKTVEANLARVYRKLGINSRSVRRGRRGGQRLLHP